MSSNLATRMRPVLPTRSSATKTPKDTTVRLMTIDMSRSPVPALQQRGSHLPSLQWPTPKIAVVTAVAGTSLLQYPMIVSLLRLRRTVQGLVRQEQGQLIERLAITRILSSWSLLGTGRIISHLNTLHRIILRTWRAATSEEFISPAARSSRSNNGDS